MAYPSRDSPLVWVEFVSVRSKGSVLNRGTELTGKSLRFRSAYIYFYLKFRTFTATLGLMQDQLVLLRLAQAQIPAPFHGPYSQALDDSLAYGFSSRLRKKAGLDRNQTIQYQLY
jgi:hypothetical protein